VSDNPRGLRRTLVDPSGHQPAGTGCAERGCARVALPSGRRGRRFKSGHPDPGQRPLPPWDVALMRLSTDQRLTRSLLHGEQMIGWQFPQSAVMLPFPVPLDASAPRSALGGPRGARRAAAHKLDQINLLTRHTDTMLAPGSLLTRCWPGPERRQGRGGDGLDRRRPAPGR
jgi:hypothetical protein